MLYPDSMQRTVLGWQIRWIAGLFLLLMVAAGAIPVSGTDASDPLLDARNGALHSAAGDERATSQELCVATGELLGSKSGSETEAEEDQPDASCLPIPIRVIDPSGPTLALGFEFGGPEALEALGRTGPRAPPHA